MSILKKTFAVLTSCAIMLSLAACSAEPKESLVEKPEDLSDRAIVVDYLGLAAELPDAIYDQLGKQVFPTTGSPAAPEGVTVNGQDPLPLPERCCLQPCSGTAEHRRSHERSRVPGSL